MISILLGAAIACTKPILINKSKYEWNSYDKMVLKLAKVRCGFKYRNSPCLKKFIKTGVKDYIVICTGEK